MVTPLRGVLLSSPDITVPEIVFSCAREQREIIMNGTIVSDRKNFRMSNSFVKMKVRKKLNGK
jgi:hypothetical protein